MSPLLKAGLAAVLTGTATVLGVAITYLLKQGLDTASLWASVLGLPLAVVIAVSGVWTAVAAAKASREPAPDMADVERSGDIHQRHTGTAIAHTGCGDVKLQITGATITVDPAILPADTAGVPSAAHVRRTLPRDIPEFTGRGDELKTLLKTVEEGAETGRPVLVCAIDGMAGVGKTTLAVHAAHRLASRFPDGQLFLRLHAHTPGQQPVEPGDALAALLRQTGMPGLYATELIGPGPARVAISGRTRAAVIPKRVAGVGSRRQAATEQLAERWVNVADRFALGCGLTCYCGVTFVVGGGGLADGNAGRRARDSGGGGQRPCRQAAPPFAAGPGSRAGLEELGLRGGQGGKAAGAGIPPGECFLDSGQPGSAVEECAVVAAGGPEAVVSEAEAAEAVRAFPGVPLLFNWAEGGKTPPITLARLRELGYRIVIFPISTLLAATAAMRETLQQIREAGTPAAALAGLPSFGEFVDFIGLPQVREAEQRYAVPVPGLGG